MQLLTIHKGVILNLLNAFYKGNLVQVYTTFKCSIKNYFYSSRNSNFFQFFCIKEGAIFNSPCAQLSNSILLTYGAYFTFYIRNYRRNGNCTFIMRQVDFTRKQLITTPLFYPLSVETNLILTYFFKLKII